MSSTNETEILEDKLRQNIAQTLPFELTPVMLRAAFHDAGTYDAVTHTGGANGALHFAAELARPENSSLVPVINLLSKLREDFSGISWADMIAVGGAGAVEKCKGPIIKVGLGRVDATEVAPEHRLPRTDQDAPTLKERFRNMGFSMQEVVLLAGAHTLGKAGGLPFTHDLYDFTNSFYQQLLKEPEAGLALLPTDKMLVEDEESRMYVQLYAANQALFFQDFAKVYHKTTWLGQPITNN